MRLEPRTLLSYFWDSLMSESRSYRSLFFQCFLRVSSRPERHGNLSLQEISGAEWRDPEGVSAAMPLQGILPRGQSQQPDATRNDFIGVRGIGQFLPSPGTSRRTTVSGTMHGKNSPSTGSEQALWQHGQVWCFGIPPLRAMDLLWEQRFPRRSGRDDSFYWISKAFRKL